jgi:hypothetical protein
MVLSDVYRLECYQTITMSEESPTPFPTLPIELICQIFESTADFSVVAALAKTARIFYHVWRQHATSICRDVGSRAFLTPADAERLVDVQEVAEAGSHPQDDTQEGRANKSILRAKRFLRIAHGICACSRDWVNKCAMQDYRVCLTPYWQGDNIVHVPEEDWPMRPHEIARFEHSLCNFWAIGIMDMSPHLKGQASAFLDKCTPQDLCRLEEASRWASYIDENCFGSWGINFQDEVWGRALDLVQERCRAYEQRSGRTFPRPSARYTFLGWFAFFDETQWYLDCL